MNPVQAAPTMRQVGTRAALYSGIATLGLGALALKQAISSYQNGKSFSLAEFKATLKAIFTNQKQLWKDDKTSLLIADGTIAALLIATGLDIRSSLSHKRKHTGDGPCGGLPDHTPAVSIAGPNLGATTEITQPLATAEQLLPTAAPMATPNLEAATAITQPLATKKKQAPNPWRTPTKSTGKPRKRSKSPPSRDGEEPLSAAVPPQIKTVISKNPTRQKCRAQELARQLAAEDPQSAVITTRLGESALAHTPTHITPTAIHCDMVLGLKSGNPKTANGLELRIVPTL